MTIMSRRRVRFALLAIPGLLLIWLVALFAGQRWAWYVFFFVGEFIFGPSSPGDPL